MIITVDPGLICGIATLTCFNDELEFFSHEAPAERTVRSIHTAMTESDLQTCLRTRVHAERYDIGSGRRGKTSQPDALEVIGALRYISAIFNVTFALQPRAERLKISMADLKKFGWYKKTKDGHANAAAQHMGYALLTHYPVRYMEMLEAV